MGPDGDQALTQGKGGEQGGVGGPDLYLEKVGQGPHARDQEDRHGFLEDLDR